MLTYLAQRFAITRSVRETNSSIVEPVLQTLPEFWLAPLPSLIAAPALRTTHEPPIPLPMKVSKTHEARRPSHPNHNGARLQSRRAPSPPGGKESYSSNLALLIDKVCVITYQIPRPLLPAYGLGSGT